MKSRMLKIWVILYKTRGARCSSLWGPTFLDQSHLSVGKFATIFFTFGTYHYVYKRCFLLLLFFIFDVACLSRVTLLTRWT